jgi:hypothetical protein
MIEETIKQPQNKTQAQPVTRENVIEKLEEKSDTKPEEP